MMYNVMAQTAPSSPLAGMMKGYRKSLEQKYNQDIDIMDAMLLNDGADIRISSYSSRPSPSTPQSQNYSQFHLNPRSPSSTATHQYIDESDHRSVSSYHSAGYYRRYNNIQSFLNTNFHAPRQLALQKDRLSMDELNSSHHRQASLESHTTSRRFQQLPQQISAVKHADRLNPPTAESDMLLNEKLELMHRYKAHNDEQVEIPLDFLEQDNIELKQRYHEERSKNQKLQKLLESSRETSTTDANDNRLKQVEISLDILEQENMELKQRYQEERSKSQNLQKLLESSRETSTTDANDNRLKQVEISLDILEQENMELKQRYQEERSKSQNLQKLLESSRETSTTDANDYRLKQVEMSLNNLKNQHLDLIHKYEEEKLVSRGLKQKMRMQLQPSTTQFESSNVAPNSVHVKRLEHALERATANEQTLLSKFERQQFLASIDSQTYSLNSKKVLNDYLEAFNKKFSTITIACVAATNISEVVHTALTNVLFSEYYVKSLKATKKLAEIKRRSSANTVLIQRLQSQNNSLTSVIEANRRKNSELINDLTLNNDDLSASNKQLRQNYDLSIQKIKHLELVVEKLRIEKKTLEAGNSNMLSQYKRDSVRLSTLNASLNVDYKEAVTKNQLLEKRLSKAKGHIRQLEIQLNKFQNERLLSNESL